MEGGRGGGMGVKEEAREGGMGGVRKGGRGRCGVR